MKTEQTEKTLKMETTSVTDSNEQLCDQVQILLQRVDQYRNDAQRMEEAKYALEAAIANIDLVGYPQLVEIKRNMVSLHIFCLILWYFTII